MYDYIILLVFAANRQSFFCGVARFAAGIEFVKYANSYMIQRHPTGMTRDVDGCRATMQRVEAINSSAARGQNTCADCGASGAEGPRSFRQQGNPSNQKPRVVPGGLGACRSSSAFGS